VAKQDTGSGDRRPLASRQTGWAAWLTRLALRTPVTPDAVSCIGMVFATLGAVAFVYAPRWPLLFLAGAVLIQLRLLCNMLDGLVAVEGRRGGPTGILFNEIPDRYEDVVLLAGFAMAGGVLSLGLVAGILAVTTAYLRAFGGSLGLAQDFRGPMAKPHRMALLTAGAIVALVERLAFGTTDSPKWVLAVLIAGTLLTCGRRMARMASGVRARA
jgi:phosphatidylglycerophosphate synthase